MSLPSVCPRSIRYRSIRHRIFRSALLGTTLWAPASLLAVVAFPTNLDRSAWAAAPASNQNEPAAKSEDSDAPTGLDFALQGEYMGVIEDWDGNWGAQVIALGNGELQLNLIEGGLPGLKADSSKPTHTLKLAIDESQRAASGMGEAFSVKISDQKLTVFLRDGESQGKELGRLQKVVRQSSTLGAKPPADATVLYSSDVNLFEGAKKSGENLGVGGKSKIKLGDHRLHLEFRTPYQPNDRGQGRGNSGVYIQGRYELQVLDSFGLEGKDNECGGIYSISSPRLNMCFPPHSWQTYDLEFQAARYQDGKKIENARVTIKHNGVVIHDQLELKSGTPGYLPEGPEPAELFLQDHGNPVEFRNIWVVQSAK